MVWFSPRSFTFHSSLYSPFPFVFFCLTFPTAVLPIAFCNCLNLCAALLPLPACQSLLLNLPRTHLSFPCPAADYLALSAPLLEAAKHRPLNPSAYAPTENKGQSLVYGSITIASGKGQRKRKVFDFTCLLCSLIIVGIYGCLDPPWTCPTRLLDPPTSKENYLTFVNRMNITFPRVKHDAYSDYCLEYWNHIRQIQFLS